MRKVANLVSDACEQSNLLINISTALAKLERYDEALKVAHSLYSKLDKSITLKSLSYRFAEAGQYNKALETARSITSKRYKSYRIDALLGVAETLLKAGHHQKALDSIEEAQKVASSLTDEYEQNTAQRKLSNAYAKANQPDKALEIVSLITKKWCCLPARQEIAKIFAESGQLDKALEAARGIRAKSQICPTLLQICNRAVELENDDRFFEAIDLIPSDYYRSVALQRASEKLAEAGHYNKATEFANRITDSKVRMNVISKINEARAV